MKPSRLNILLILMAAIGLYFLSQKIETPAKMQEHQSLEAKKRSSKKARLSFDPKKTAENDEKKLVTSDVQRKPERSKERDPRHSLLNELQHLPVEDELAYVNQSNEMILEKLYRYANPNYPWLITREAQANQDLPPTVIVAHSFLVQMEDAKTPFQADSRLAHDLTQVNDLGAGLFEAQFLMKDLKKRLAVRDLLRSQRGVAFVSSNPMMYGMVAPNDPYYDKQWHLENRGTNPRPGSDLAFQDGVDVKAHEAWNQSTDCRSVPVAIADSGVDIDHPDIRNNLDLEQSRSFVPGESIDDQFYHGTHVAGIVGAQGNNQLGVAGICWQAKMIVVKVLDQNNRGATSWVLAGFRYAALNTDALIINASLGSAPLNGFSEETSPYRGTTKVIEEQGKLLVVAAGNSGVNTDEAFVLPTSDPNPHIIAVANISGDLGLNQTSNYGTRTVDIAAPGTDILSLAPLSANNPSIYEPRLLQINGAAVAGYMFETGTSMAAPAVAGMLALFWSHAPNLTPLEIKEKLLATSRSAPNLSDRTAGGGRLADLSTLMKSVVAEYSLTIVNPESQPRSGEILGVEIAKRTSSDYELSHIRLVNGDEAIAEFAKDQLKFEFVIPDLETYDLAIEVEETSGFVARMPIEGLSIKNAGLKSVDFSLINKLPGGDISCPLSQKVYQEVRTLITFKLSSKALCQKVCAALIPVYQSNSLHTLYCGDNVPANEEEI